MYLKGFGVRILLFFVVIFNVFVFAKKEVITPIPQLIHYNKPKALLGKKLFFDKRISADGSVSCASCHSPEFGGADPRVVSVGVYGKKGIIQSPTVYNAVFEFRQFWNGRAFDLKEQIKGPTHNPVEMGLNNHKIEKLLNSDPIYKKMFLKIYGKKHITYNMFADAVAEFEKALITPNCKFDKYLRGQAKLTKQELHGYELFKEIGCITCHNGVDVGGNSFQKIGIIHPAKNRTGDRYEITHNLDDKFVYKVSTLRNIALSAPYFHNGSTFSLAKAVQKMAYFNLGLRLKKEEVGDIVAFLDTLTGEKPKILNHNTKVLGKR